MTYIIHPDDCNETAQAGGKIASLASLEREGLHIPQWFALSPEAFYTSLTPFQRRALKRANDALHIRALLANLQPCKDVIRELTQTLTEMFAADECVAVRSSAMDEDGLRHSFAGQLDSFLFVPPDQITERVTQVWRSAFGERALSYRSQAGINIAPRPPAVLIQRMVAATVSGVAFSADPITGHRGIVVVSAVYGIGTALVSGDCDADTYHVDREGRIILRRIAVKQYAHRFSRDNKEGISRAEVSEPVCSQPALNDNQVRAIADLARKAESHFGRPQDIEWAIENEQVFLLQSRPITSLSRMANPEGAVNLWDNSNIAESYGGVTTPLTFSFARRAYEEVYRQFCRMMRVPQESVLAHADTFRRMIGLICGRVYYNLMNWYRVLSLLPGFKINRRFMEQMMGVKEGLPEHFLSEMERTNWRARLKDSFNLLRTVGGLAANYFLLPRRVKKFYERLDAALALSKDALGEMRADELAAYYRDLEKRLLTLWDAPLINDFFAMIFYGALRRMVETWCEDPGLQNGLLCGEGGIISAEPARRVRLMAETAAKHESFAALLCDAPLNEIMREMKRLPDFEQLYENYLDRFGDRCLDELKLESLPLQDDPLILLRSVGQLSRQLSPKEPPLISSSETDMRALAELKAQKSLSRRPLRRIIFRWVLGNARRRVRERENLRFERTRLFGRVRRIFIEIGRRFHALDLLEHPRDIFYLEVEEALGFIEGTCTTSDLKSLVALRQTEFARYRESSPPADRFETRGIVNQGNDFQSALIEKEDEPGEQRKGVGCSPGIARGRARVVSDPRNASVQPGDILIAERTDPAWVMLFASAAGVVVERGSALSHSAIVAREMGIPAIVSLPGATRWLKDGDHIEIDGSTGTVSRFNAHQERAANEM